MTEARCSTCRGVPARGTLACEMDDPPRAYCPRCFSSHVVVTHEDPDSKEARDTLAFRQIVFYTTKHGSSVGWALLERPPGGDQLPPEQWLCIGVTFDRVEAAAWSALEDGRVAKTTLFHPPRVVRKGPNKYPNVVCSKHGTAPGYIVCDHIVNGAASVAHVKLASVEEIGQVICSDGDHGSLQAATLVCASCAKERGWVGLGEDE